VPQRGVRAGRRGDTKAGRNSDRASGSGVGATHASPVPSHLRIVGVQTRIVDV